MCPFQKIYKEGCLHFNFEYPDKRWVLVIKIWQKETLQYITLQLIVRLIFFIWVTRLYYMQIVHALVYCLCKNQKESIWLGSWVQTMSELCLGNSIKTHMNFKIKTLVVDLQATCCTFQPELEEQEIYKKAFLKSFIFSPKSCFYYI